MADTIGWDGLVLADAQEITYALNGRIPVGFRVFGQQLALVQLAIRCTTDDIGECAATVDPEIPLAVSHVPFLAIPVSTMRTMRERVRQ